MRKNLTNAAMAFLVLLVLIGITGKVLAQTWLAGSAGKHGSSSSGADSVALLHVEGVITGGAPGGSPLSAAGSVSSEDLCDKLYKILDDDSIKAVLLRVNSPGGSAAASDEIYHAIQAVRKAGKPVVVSMGDVAASGGYYISSAADYIYADPATLTGSIGVIFELMNWDEAAKKLGVKSEALHAGQFKDIGSPWREMTPEEHDALSAMLTQVHNQFIKAVDEGRSTLDEAAVRKLATGMIYNGEDAAKNGLVDGLGGLEEAKVKARSLGKLPADAPVEEYGEGSFWAQIFGASANQGLTPQSLQQLASVYAAQQLLQHGAADALGNLSRGLYLNTTLQDLQIR